MNTALIQFHWIIGYIN